MLTCCATKTWADVYNDLEGSGVNVVGGRTVGPGVAGFTLGGGYSWLVYHSLMLLWVALSSEVKSLTKCLSC